jgi:lipopolysaccharide exporter
MPLIQLTSLKRYFLAERLRSRAIAGGTWLAVGSLTSQAFRLGRNIVLARLLVPQSFGAMAIVLSVGAMMDAFTEVGTREAIIQSPRGLNAEFLNAAWWFATVRGVASYAFIFIFSPTVAKFYHDSELTGLIRVAMLAIIFRSVMSPASFLSLKAMEFKRWAALQYGSAVIGSLITLALAFAFPSVWALCLGFAVEYAVLCFVSYLWFPFLPKLPIKKSPLEELWKFSRGVLGLSFLNLMYVRMDIFVLGKVISGQQLGIYSLVISSVQAASTFLLNYQGQILLPLFSRLQADAERTNRLLAKGASILVILSLPALIFAFFSGRTLLTLMYGALYGVAFWPFVLAVATMFLNVLNAQITTVFYAVGKPQLHRTCVLLMVLSMGALIYPASRYWGMVGAQAVALVTVIAGYGVQIGLLRTLHGFRLALDVRSLGLQLAGPLAVLAIAAAIRNYFALSRPAQNLLFGVSMSLAATLCGGWILLRTSGYRFRMEATSK